MEGQQSVKQGAEHCLCNPVDAHGGRHGEADPQGEQWHDDHHGLHALVHRSGSIGILLALVVGRHRAVEGLRNLRGDKVCQSGEHRDNPKAKAHQGIGALDNPLQGRNLCQVDAQERKVNVHNVGNNGADGVNVLVDMLGQDDFLICLIGGREIYAHGSGE